MANTEATRYHFLLKGLLILLSLMFVSLPIALADSSKVMRLTVKDPKVQKFITHMVYQYHFDKRYLKQLFAKITIQPLKIIKIKTKTHRVVKSMAWYQYRQLFITQSRINHGVRFWHKHQSLLNQLHKKYHVPIAIIVAIVGVESNYGHNAGGYPVFNTLANRAFSEHYYRSHFFQKELEQFLLLCHQLHMNPLSITGSSAGAIGPGQFMPDTYRHYSVELKDRHNSICDLQDSLATMANYLSKLGWNEHLFVAQQVKAKAPINKKPKLPQPSFKLKYTAKQLSHFDISLPKLPKKQKFRFIALKGQHQLQYWLGSKDFYLITLYNRSTYYAMAVYQLSKIISDQYHKGVSNNKN